MNILADFHHADLWWSLQLLADRLGATLYRPYGMEWFDQGYFKLYGNLRAKDPERWIAKQYLEDTLFEIIHSSHQSQMLGRETYNYCPDYPLFNVLTLDQAKQMQIDVVICSVHENESYFAKLKEFWPNAKFIRQVGNDLDTNIDEVTYPNLLSSATAPFEAFRGPNKALYKQEFSLALFNTERYTYYGYPIYRNIYSFQNDIEQFEETWDFWTMLKHQLREYKFQSFGVGCEQGKIYPKTEYIQKMLEATFVVQSKGPWEGYGHTIFNSYCLGRPMIIKFSDYQGKMAEPLLIKDQTYLEMTDPDIVEKIRFYSNADRYLTMSNACQEIFRATVNFDQEFEERIKPFFENLR